MSFSFKINKVSKKYWLGASVYKNKQHRIIVNTTHLLVVERFYFCLPQDVCVLWCILSSHFLQAFAASSSSSSYAASSLCKRSKRLLRKQGGGERHICKSRLLIKILISCIEINFAANFPILILLYLKFK